MRCLLEIIQDVCTSVHKLPIPANVIGNNDEDVVLMLRLLQSLGNQLSQKKSLQATDEQATFTTVAGENQGKLTTLAAGFKKLRPHSLYDGLNTAIEASDRWLYLREYRPSTGHYRIRNGELHMLGVSAGETWTFEYQSKNWIIADDAMTNIARFQNDQDCPRIDDELLTLGVIAKYLGTKGLPNDLEVEEYNSYEDAIIANQRGTDSVFINSNTEAEYASNLEAARASAMRVIVE